MRQKEKVELGEFVFSSENLKKAQKIIGRYPEGKQASAVIPLLDLAQRQCGGWLPHAAIKYVADFLQISEMRAYEVATFYTMFNLTPVGKHVVQVCTTTPCWLRGAEDLLTAGCRKLGIAPGQTTLDHQFTLKEVECLGACVNAPMVQVNDDYYEDLTPETFDKLLEDLSLGKELKPGSQSGRQCSAPAGFKSEEKDG